MRVRANGIEIAFEEHGRGDRPLLLVHGFTGFRQDFASQLAGLAQHGRVLAPDLRGHGESGRTGDPASYGFEELTADLLGFLDALGIERCDLLGHSMGGMVALRAALAAPGRIASLVLMDTAPGPLAFIDRAQLELAARVAREAGMAVLAQILRARARDDAERSAPGPARGRGMGRGALLGLAHRARGRDGSGRLRSVRPRADGAGRPHAAARRDRAARPRCWWASSTTSSARRATRSRGTSAAPA